MVHICDESSQQLCLIVLLLLLLMQSKPLPWLRQTERVNTSKTTKENTFVYGLPSRGVLLVPKTSLVEEEEEKPVLVAALDTES